MADYNEEAIDILHEQGKAVVCYISIGTWEEWRHDAQEFPEDALGNSIDGCGDGSERWIDIKSEVRRGGDLPCIMRALIK